MATMPKELKHFQDICTDCTFQKHLSNKTARAISAVRIKLNKWFETVNALNGFTKALPYPKIGNDNLKPRGRLEKSAHQLLHNLNFKKK